MSSASSSGARRASAVVLHLDLRSVATSSLGHILGRLGNQSLSAPARSRAPSSEARSASIGNLLASRPGRQFAHQQRVARCRDFGPLAPKRPKLHWGDRHEPKLQ